MYNELPDVFDVSQQQSATADICRNMELFGAVPAKGEHDPRDLPDLEEAKELVTHNLFSWQSLLSDSCIETEIQNLLWNMVNIFHRKVQQLDKGFDAASFEVRASMDKQNGGEIESYELETLQQRAQDTLKARDYFEALRDHAAECYHDITCYVWSPVYGSRINRHNDIKTASIIDSRDMLKAEKEKKIKACLPEGKRVAIAGGQDFNDHILIYKKLDAIHAKYPDMVLLHGGSPKGVDKIASCWAENRKISQVVFKPDWNHGNRAGFLRNDKIINAQPIGLIAFPGTGVTEHLINKAKKKGIKVQQCA